MIKRLFKPASPVVNSLFHLTNIIIPLLLFLVSIPVFLYYYGKDGYGVWVLGSSILGIAGKVNFGFNEATIRFVAKHRGDADGQEMSSTASATVVYYLVVGMIVAVVIFGLSSTLAATLAKEESLEVETRILFRVCAFVFPFMLLFGAFQAVAQGVRIYALATVMNVSRILVWTVASMVAAFCGAGVSSLAWLSLTTYAFFMILFYFLLRRLVPTFHFTVREGFKRLKQVGGFGLWTWLAAVGAMFRVSGSRVIVGLVLGPQAVTDFSVAQNISQQIGQVSVVMTHSSFPEVGGWSNLGDRLRDYLASASSVVITLVLLVFVGAWWGGEPFLAAWLGADFNHEVVAAFRFHSISFALSGIGTLPYFILIGTDQHRYAGSLHFLSGAAAALAVVIGATMFGTVGAACGTVVFGFVLVGFGRIFVEHEDMHWFTWFLVRSMLAAGVSVILYEFVVAGFLASIFGSSFAVAIITGIIGSAFFTFIDYTLNRRELSDVYAKAKILIAGATSARRSGGLAP